MSALPRPALEPAPGPAVGVRRGRDDVGAGAAHARRVSALLVRATSAELLAVRQASVLALLVELLAEPSLERALDAFAGALAARFGADRVAVALAAEDGTLRCAAISQQALVDVASAEAKLLLAAMEEACELECAVRFPERQARLGVLTAHRALAGRRADTVLASVPLYHDDALIGAVLLERRDADAFEDGAIALLEEVALAVAPLLALRREAARGPLERARRGGGEWLERHLGSTRAGRRLALGLGTLALALVSIWPVAGHVAAEAELVPRERRLVTAPVDGYVEEVTVSAGERVVPGQVLARLDRRELELELTRRDSEIASAEAEFRAAMASHDRQATAVARAVLERERALRLLAERRLERSELRAPIAGLVISGDPGGATGTPVARGETLFEIAPAEGYEVHLLVDEKDVHDVHEGQRGTLGLRTRPDEALGLIVQAIHPVAESGDGASRFRVRARLAEAPGETLRPGQSGVARLEAGRLGLAAKLLRPVRRRLAELRWRLPW